MRALRAVLVVVLAGTVFVQALMLWALISGNDPEDGLLPLTPLCVITILGIGTAQVAMVCVWRLVTMVRRGTVFPHAAFRYVDAIIGVIVAAALVWFAVTAGTRPRGFGSDRLSVGRDTLRRRRHSSALHVADPSRMERVAAVISWVRRADGGMEAPDGGG